MTAYENKESGRFDDHRVRYELTADGNEIMVGDAIEVGERVRELMRPGDTYQELNEGTSDSDVFDYDHMCLEWKRRDAFDAGDMAEYDRLMGR